MPHCYSTVSNMRRYGQQWQNQILLFYYIFHSPLPQISLSPSTLSHFFSLCHSLSLPSLPCSRKLLKITLQSSLRSRRLTFQSSLPISPILTTDLATSFSTTHLQSCRLMGFDVGFGSVFWISVVWVVGRGFGLVGLGFQADRWLSLGRCFFISGLLVG